MAEKLAIDGGLPVRSDRLPFFKVTYGYPELRGVIDVFESGVFGSVYPDAHKVLEFEAAFAEFAGARHAVAFSSGTTAQHASLIAAGVGPGDEVIVPPLTFSSTAYTVLLAGATPVFADVDDATICLDPERVASAVTPRTRAVVPVHWFGYPVEMDELGSVSGTHGLTVIEDCAHAYGTVYRDRRAGTIGAMACWSLQQSKVLTAAGEGGVLTTDDDGLAAVARSVCDHGKDKGPGAALDGYEIVRVGNNYRLTEMQAAFALAQLGRAEEMLAGRRAHLDYMVEGLRGVDGLRLVEGDLPRPDIEVGPSYFPVRFDEDAFTAPLGRLSDALDAEGVQNVRIADDEFGPSHPLFREMSPPAVLPVADRVRRELTLLPLYPDMTGSDLDDVVAAVRKVAARFAS